MFRYFPSLLLSLALALWPVLATAQADGPDLTDAEVAHVAVTANSIDIELAGLARERASRPAVGQFAATMIRDHGAVNQQAAALADRLGVTPEDNVVSRSLQEDAAKASAALEPLRSAAFDRAYMEREIAYHQAVLDALDQVLIPTTSNGELKGLLEQVRPTIAAHLEHAKLLGQSLRAGK